jgi:hypothetical protein
MATNPSLLIVPYRFKAAKLYSQLPESGAGDFVVTRATTALRTNASGFLESIASGVPRLDYPAFGGCPSLFIEPAATNLVLRSQEIDNVYWTKINMNAFGSGSVANTSGTLDPYGTNVADYIQENTATGAHSLISIFAGNVSGTTYTWSVFAKAAERNIVNLLNNATGAGSANFNLTTGVATLINGVSATIENYGNGWYRCSLTYTSGITGNHNIQVRICDAAGNTSYTGTGTSGLTVFGAQLETGTVATSYIPTVATSITRNADVISVASVSGLIGQTQGTLYAEVNVTKLLGTQSRYILNISDGTANNRIYLAFSGASSNIIRARVWSGNVLQASIDTTTISTLGIRKLAIAYANNDIVFYMNGVQIGTDTSATIPACNRVNLGSSQANLAQVNDPISAAAIYTSRLSNAELESLTTL